ncbi:MAG: hypothetical protein A2X02_06895 [Bacteroidetes bacterium GWF2_29_10]|nr:MAG: hypothetical protein A2X02_06895 [Bacteroidetes bacterium GWF2_29_10]
MYLISDLRKLTLKNTDDSMQENILNLESSILLEFNANKAKVNSDMNFALQYLNSLGNITESNKDYVNINNIKLKQWTIKGKTIQNNSDIVDAIKATGVGTVTIFQKFENGYIRVATNVIEANGQRAIGTFIDFNSPVVQSIERGQRYQGRAFVVDKWYLTNYHPIIIDGEIKGILYVGNQDLDFEAISKYYATKNYFGSGYPYIVNSDGILTGHPTSVGVSVAKYKWFEEMKKNIEGKVLYEWEGKEKTQYFKYIKEIDSYITVGFYTEDMYAHLAIIRNTVIVSLLLSTLIILIVLFFSIKNLNYNLSKIIDKIKDATQSAINGNLNTRASTDDISFEFAPIVNGLNSTLDAVIGPLNVAAEYVDRIAKGDIPPKITDNYNGDFNEIKNNLNMCIDGLGGLVESSEVLEMMAQNDYTKKVEGRYLGIFAKTAESINYVKDRVDHTINIIIKLAKGDMNEYDDLKRIGKRCENDQLMPSIIMLMDALKDIANKANLIANGDLTVSIEKRSDDDLLMHSLKEMLISITRILEDFKGAADNIANASQQMSTTSIEMSQGASEQASSAEEVSSSMEEMASNIQQNTDNSQQTEKIALNAAEGINKVALAAKETLDKMKEIAEKVSIIGEIARQTNILALNAAVEAARAGEHGKGFAVVAAEVRKLAERSQASAVEIDALTKISVKSTEEAGSLMNAIAPEIQKTAKLVQEITAASIEQTSGAEQINNAIQQLNKVTQQNAAASEEMATGSEELSGQAEKLLESISFFKLENDLKKKTSDNKLRQEHKFSKQTGGKVYQNDSQKVNRNTGNGITLNMSKDLIDKDYERF